MNRKEARKQLDVNVTLALVKCLSEQVHGMQWDYSGRLKQKFNRLLNVVRQYEKEIDVSVMEVGDESIEAIYDTFMESIIESKEIALQGYE